jgi:hypothetical protein
LGTDKLPPGCAQIYTGGAGGPGTTYTYTTKGPSLATACCAANADGASVGSVLIEKRAVPLLCPPTQSASTGGGSTGTTLVE